MGILAREGHELTPRADEAEVLVVNTCSFIESAQKESVDAILEMAEHKKFGSAKKLIVAGCLVERYRDQILSEIPEVDAVVGTGEVARILEAVEGDLRVLPAEPPAFLYHDLTPRILTTPKHAAYIKVAEGCDHPCSFCIIPQLRGKFRSRRLASVVREAQTLAASGTREITLIGQDTTSYGEDLGLGGGLSRLLESLAQKIGAAPVVRSAAGSVQRAADYVQAHSVKDLFIGIERAARRRPAATIGIALVAGFLVGRAIRSR